MFRKQSSSPPQKRGSRATVGALPPWTPAFAGMTKSADSFDIWTNLQRAEPTSLQVSVLDTRLLYYCRPGLKQMPHNVLRRIGADSRERRYQFLPPPGQQSKKRRLLPLIPLRRRD